MKIIGLLLLMSSGWFAYDCKPHWLGLTVALLAMIGAYLFMYSK